MPETDPLTFRGLNFQQLALDKKHVFARGYVVPGLSPVHLRVYTPSGERYGMADFSPSDCYLVSGPVGYRPDGQPLTKAELLNFQPPAPYKLAYPLPASGPKKTPAKTPKTHP